MSLYDDIEDGVKDTKDVAGWSSSFKFMQSQLQAKKAGNCTGTPGGKRRGGTIAPVIDLKKPTGGEELHFDHKTGKATRSPALGIAAFIQNLTPEPSVFAGVKDEYNPLFPNDYEDMIKKRRRERRERERERDREREDRARERGDERPRRRREDEEEREDEGGEMKPRPGPDDDDDYEFDRSKMGAAIAPPKSLLEESSSTPPPDTGRVQNPFGLEEDDPQAVRAAAGTKFGLGGSVASKIMAKYGYKEGQGLGKKEQGMSQALLVEKTSRRGGKIIHERDIKADSPTHMLPPPGKPDLSNANLLKNPSKVVLLRNMVGPGEVDPDLEGETAEECLKYGKVVKCVIFEIPEVPEEEAVRIFVEFERQEAAIKAIVDLNGRYFGGKIVKACFYNPDKFRHLDLADDLL